MLTHQFVLISCMDFFMSLLLPPPLFFPFDKPQVCNEFQIFYIDLYTFKHAHSQSKTHFASGSCLEFYALYHGCFWWLSKMIVLNYWQPSGNCLHPPIYFLPFLLFSHNRYVRIYQRYKRIPAVLEAIQCICQWPLFTALICINQKPILL